MCTHHATNVASRSCALKIKAFITQSPQPARCFIALNVVTQCACLAHSFSAHMHVHAHPRRSGVVVVRASVRRVMVVTLAVSTRGLVRVCARGPHETTPSSVTAEIAHVSRHEVFRRVTLVAGEAYRHYHASAASPAEAVALFLVRTIERAKARARARTRLQPMAGSAIPLHNRVGAIGSTFMPSQSRCCAIAIPPHTHPTHFTLLCPTLVVSAVMHASCSDGCGRTRHSSLRRAERPEGCLHLSRTATFSFPTTANSERGSQTS